MCTEEINILSDKIYKATCEIEDLIELKELIVDNKDNNIFREKINRDDKEIEKTKTFNFKRAM